MSKQYLRCSIFAALISLLVSCAPGPPAIMPAIVTTTAATRVPKFQHVFMIVLENKEYQEVIGEEETPYFNSLAQQYSVATNYYGIRHPSLPNYLALTGGSTFNIKSDCTDCFVAQPNIVDQLEAAGKSWKAYMESMPSACFIGDAPPLYKQKHNPFIYYNDIRTNPKRCQQVVPFTEFAKDLANNALPNYIWITPNMCNDGHDCPTSSSDAWLATWVPRILASPAWRNDGALFITYDEGDSKVRFAGSCCQEGNGGHIATLVISPLGKPGYQSPVAYDHYSLLRTIENAWNLPELGSAACPCAPPMADFFVSPGAAQRQYSTMRILIVEDEQAIATFMIQGLTEAGYAVDLAGDGAEALHWIAIAEYDLIILDLMLPDADGISLCDQIRKHGLHIPVLMVTARDTVDDRVAGLDSGADDYLIKPFAFAELLARIRALLRREPVFKGRLLQIADLTLDTVSRTVRRADQIITLTTKEYSLLEFLMRHPNQTLTRTAIGEHVWDYDFDNVSNLIDVHIFGLRRKIDDPHEIKLLHTVRGVGYRLGAETTM